MARRSTEPEEVFQEFTENLKSAFGDSLKSIILFGSGARADFRPKESDINFLVVVEDNSPSELARVLLYIKKWSKKGIALPLFLTQDYIDNARDTYPVEFLNMRSAYRVVHGTDVLESLTLEHEDIRRQCERELRGKLLHLRQSFLLSGGETKLLPELVSNSLNAFVPIFRALLFLIGKDPGGSKEAVLKDISELFNLDDRVFTDLVAIAKKQKKETTERIKELYDSYVELIAQLTDEVDHLDVQIEPTGEVAESEENEGETESAE